MSKPSISVACQWTQDDTSMLLFPYIWHKLTQFIATTRPARSAGQTLPQPSPSSSTPINTPSIYINSATLPRCLPRASHRPLCFCHPLLPQDSFSNTSNSHRKIVQRYSLGLADGKVVKSGDYVTLSPFHCMTHDNSWPVALKFMSIGASKIHDSKQIVMTLDHDVQNKSETNLKKYRQRAEAGCGFLSCWKRNWTSDYGGRGLCMARYNDCCQ
jgi:hypothetical protein